MEFKKGSIFKNEYLLTSEVYNGFINIFNDRNLLHTDKEFAKGKGFESEVMHGNILNCFLSHFVGECLPLENVMIFAQEIKYLKPVYLDDQLQLIACVEDFFESVKMLVFKFYFTNQKGLKVATGKIQIGVI